jgi:hypothetical protein
LYLGNTGIVGTKDGAATFLLSNSGDATFSGDIAGANLDIGVTPAISGTKMTGSGAHIQKDGKFALGTASKSIVYNGSDFYLNGRMISGANLSIAGRTALSQNFTAAGPIVSYSDTRPGFYDVIKVADVEIPWTGWSQVKYDFAMTSNPPFTLDTIGSKVLYIGGTNVWGPATFYALQVRMYKLIDWTKTNGETGTTWICPSTSVGFWEVDHVPAGQNYAMVLLKQSIASATSGYHHHIVMDGSQPPYVGWTYTTIPTGQPFQTATSPITLSGSSVYDLSISNFSELTKVGVRNPTNNVSLEFLGNFSQAQVDSLADGDSVALSVYSFRNVRYLYRMYYTQTYAYLPSSSYAASSGMQEFHFGDISDIGITLTAT